jgi:hypothetical protein
MKYKIKLLLLHLREHTFFLHLLYLLAFLFLVLHHSGLRSIFLFATIFFDHFCHCLFGLVYAKLKRMCHIYGFGVPTPFYTAGPQKETRSIEVRGVLFWKFAFIFLAFFWLCCAVLYYLFARSDFPRRSAYFVSVARALRHLATCSPALFPNRTRSKLFEAMKRDRATPAKNPAPF